jgi:hypothetical protein
MARILYYSAALIATYLIVSHATDAGKLLTSTSGAAAGVVKVFQGR